MQMQPSSNAHLVQHVSVLGVRVGDEHTVGAQDRRLQMPYGTCAVQGRVGDIALRLEHVGHFHARVHL